MTTRERALEIVKRIAHRSDEPGEKALVIDMVTVIESVLVEHDREMARFPWKWVERAMFDPRLSGHDAIKVVADHPLAPWNNGPWNVDHTPYAAKFYARYPKAKP